MDVNNDPSEVPEAFSHNNYRPSEFLRKLCRKVGKSDSHTIYSYYEFGLELTIRLNEYIEKGQKKPRNKLNKEVQGYFPLSTPLTIVKDKMKRARKMYDLFSAIDVSRIHLNEGVTGFKPEEGVVRRDVLGEGIAQGIFEAVLDNNLTIGLGVFDGCDLLGIIPTLVTPTLGHYLPRNNKHFFSL
ncbi:hypothetical protein C1645_730852 [Glomus cerebriforme]|uniref:Uncharacterized protein n=1 Tax=Glomus cerebriforme TaxID=658196 RepID=A0A397TSF6_9GLOM|nr:hypothetical protein C1645_730852 [Glomus cerebriforme]